jgi:hypothetical protein
MAHTIHYICVHQLSAYQQSIFCNDKLGSHHRQIKIHVNNLSATLFPLLAFHFYHKRINLEFQYWRFCSQRLQRFAVNLSCLIRLRYEVWMRLLLRHVKDLSLDRRGDIRLIPDPRYFTAQPELRDLMIKLAQLRLHSRAGLYILLLPRRNIKLTASP